MHVTFPRVETGNKDMIAPRRKSLQKASETGETLASSTGPPILMSIPLPGPALVSGLDGTCNSSCVCGAIGE